MPVALLLELLKHEEKMIDGTLLIDCIAETVFSEIVVYVSSDQV